MTILLIFLIHFLGFAQIEHAEQANYELKREYARLTRIETILERRIEDLEFELMLRRIR